MASPSTILYTAHATSTGGREGTSKTPGGELDLTLTTPKELGGNGARGVNPEQLFAAGYSACFIGALKFVGAQQKVAVPADTSIDALGRHRPDPGRLRHRGEAGRAYPRDGQGAGRATGGGRPQGVPLFERHARQYHGGPERRLSGPALAHGAALPDLACRRWFARTGLSHHTRHARRPTRWTSASITQWAAPSTASARAPTFPRWTGGQRGPMLRRDGGTPPLLTPFSRKRFPVPAGPRRLSSLFNQQGERAMKLALATGSAAVVALSALSACTSMDVPPGAGAMTPEPLTITLNSATSSARALVGTVVASETRYGVVFTPAPAGLPPGLHGFHVHTNPSCQPALQDGKPTPALAAGGHFDPKGSNAHGLPWGDGHLGDLPPLYVDPNGNAVQPVLAPRLKLADLKGHALMVHAGAATITPTTPRRWVARPASSAA